MSIRAVFQVRRTTQIEIDYEAENLHLNIVDADFAYDSDGKSELDSMTKVFEIKQIEGSLSYDEFLNAIIDWRPIMQRLLIEEAGMVDFHLSRVFESGDARILYGGHMHDIAEVDVDIKARLIEHTVVDFDLS